MSNTGFRPKKKLAQIYFGIPGECISWEEANGPEFNDRLIPAIKKAKEVFERERQKAESASEQPNA